jgi:hypothetical protein
MTQLQTREARTSLSAPKAGCGLVLSLSSTPVSSTAASAAPRPLWDALRIAEGQSFRIFGDFACQQRLLALEGDCGTNDFDGVSLGKRELLLLDVGGWTNVNVVEPGICLQYQVRTCPYSSPARVLLNLLHRAADSHFSVGVIKALACAGPSLTDY